jgi:hypothetical protein
VQWSFERIASAVSILLFTPQRRVPEQDREAGALAPRFSITHAVINRHRVIS